MTALVAGTCGSPASTPSPSASGASQGSFTPSTPPTPIPTPGAIVAPTPTPTATPPTGTWAKVQLPPLKPVASLTPTKKGQAGAAVTTAFRLTSLDGTSVATLASRLEVQPKIKLASTAAGSGTVTLTPSSPLKAGTTYHFAIRRPDGTIAQTWAVTAAKTLRVVGTLPYDESSDVPRNTGIEFTFDQPGVTAGAVKDAFSIKPKVSGRFEVHGKVVAFVPSKPLKAFTVYAVTLRKGVSLPGTGQKLEQDVIIHFETKRTGTIGQALVIGDPMTESATRLAPTISIYFRSDDEGGARIPKTLPLNVHRLASLKAAMSAYERIANEPEWAWSAGAPISTDALTLVLKAKVKVQRFEVQDENPRTWIQLPQTLPAGWYVATLTYGGRDQQVILQVTDLAVYEMATQTRTVIWVNSLNSGQAVADAAVTVAGTSLGRTDANGLRVAKTPAALTALTNDTGHQFVTVRDRKGRAVFVPVAAQSACGKCYTFDTGGMGGASGSDAWWHVLASDRDYLRTTDHANVWGMVRARDDGSLPKRLEVRLESYDDWTGSAIPIMVAVPTPSASGVFTATLAFKDVPVGNYNIALRADGDALGAAWVHIGPIVKPAWQLDLTTDQRAVLSGARIAVSATARFFEGTPVGGVDLRVGTESDDEEGGASRATTRTGVDGVATQTVTVTLPHEGDEGSQWSWRSVSASPTLPEEAGIMGETWVAAFLSTALLDVDARLSGTTLTITGDVHDVDFARMATADADDWEVDPAGAPRDGAKVKLAISEQIPTRKQIGTAYDFITKTTSPVYQYDTRVVDLGTRSATTGVDGTFRTTMSVKGGDHHYEVTARYTDEGGRPISAEAYGASVTEFGDERSVQLVVPGQSREDSTQYAAGDEVKVAVRGGHAVPATDRYLFTVAHLGLRSASVQAGPTFVVAFRESWIPDATLRAVRFNGTTYEPSETFDAAFRTSDRALQVSLTADAARYEPGDRAQVAIRTLDTSGDPVSASVVVRVVDEKLFAIDAAHDIDVLEYLYMSVSDGVIGISWSHGSPTMGFEGGDTGGGGGDERADFRDWLLFQRVTTGADGRATVRVDLSDDLTSWRFSASAVDTAYQAGDATLRLPVGLPFFAEAALAQEYLVGDQPVLRVRGYGSALAAGDRVAFKVTATTLGMAEATATAPAFTAASIALPSLTAGEHRIRIVASSGSGAGRHEDVLIRTIHVVSSRSIQAKTASGPLVAGFRLQGGATGSTTVVLSDGGRGRALAILMALTGSDTGRADQVLAAAIARAVLHDMFGIPDETLGTSELDLAAFQTGGGGLALLPYASADLELSALAALAGDPGIDASAFEDLFTEVRSGKNETRERRIVALAGQAALGRPVLDEIRTAAKNTKLNATERSWLAVAALAAGDEALAGELERAVLAANGQRLGPWIRVQAGDAETTATTTALVAIAAAGIGDPLAADMDDYLSSNPPKDTLLNLQRALAARSWAERTPGKSAVASLRVDGATRRVEISPAEPTWLTLTPAQLASATIAPVSGSVIVTSSWEGSLDSASLHGDGVTTFTRTVNPSGTIPVDGVVTVKFTVRLGDDADSSCWRVTDLVPSGLAPVWGRMDRYSDDDEDEDMTEADGPWRIEGQRVDFCVPRDPQNPVRHLAYVARVVTPGTYRWEPAVIQSSIVLEHGVVLPAKDLVIAR